VIEFLGLALAALMSVVLKRRMVEALQPSD
jgi:hypothetical protein